MTDRDGCNADEALTELLELGVGSLILGLRQLNVSRRELVERVPAAEAPVDALLDQIEAFAGPASAAIASILGAVGDSLDGPQGEQISDVAAMFADAGPELLRLSGLTRRT